MKKRVWLFLVVVISVLCMVAFAACGNKENEEGYEFFVEYFEAMLPDEVKREFVATFSKGVFTPSLRTSYNRWERILKKLVPESAQKSIPNSKSTPGRVQISSSNFNGISSSNSNVT